MGWHHSRRPIHDAIEPGLPEVWDLRNGSALELGFGDGLRKGDVTFGDGLPLELSSLRNPATSPTTHLSQDLMVFCRQGSDQLIQLVDERTAACPKRLVFICLVIWVQDVSA